MHHKDIPHGHGLSYKKGIADALLDAVQNPKCRVPDGHEASYRRGVEEGKRLRDEINSRVKA